MKKKSKDPYLSELDALGDLTPDEPTDLNVSVEPPTGEEEFSPPEAAPENLEGTGGLVSNVPVPVVVVIGQKQISVKDLLQFRTGQIVEIGSPTSGAVDLMVGGKILARGELVEIEGKLGVRILKMIK